MKKTLWMAGLLVLLAALCCSCGREEKFDAYSFDYFDTVTSVSGYAESREEFDRITSELFAELEAYHKLFNIYLRYEGMENLCTVNELSGGAHRTVTVDRRIIDMLLYAKEMYALTDGRVNVAMGSVLSIWHEYRELGSDDPASAELPPIEALREAAEHTDIEKLVIDEAACTVTLTDPEMRLDVGAIAKGYAVEMAAQWLAERGYEGYIFNLGGNVRVVGAKEDGAGWKVGIRNPDPEATDYLAYLTMIDMSLVTSGSYQRYYVVDGKEYHHIIDRETLMPAEGYTSVSVLCESSALGDALSTALFCMSIEEGKSLIDRLDGVEALWVLTDGTQVRSTGFPG